MAQYYVYIVRPGTQPYNIEGTKLIYSIDSRVQQQFNTTGRAHKECHATTSIYALRDPGLTLRPTAPYSTPHYCKLKPVQCTTLHQNQHKKFKTILYPPKTTDLIQAFRKKDFQILVHRTGGWYHEWRYNRQCGVI